MQYHRRGPVSRIEFGKGSGGSQSLMPPNRLKPRLRMCVGLRAEGFTATPGVLCRVFCVYVRIGRAEIWVMISDLKPFDGLVPVSFTRYRASTSGLSTWWSSRGLIGRPCFEGGFPLRCFQRLSRPFVATRRCRWRDNRYTRGTSTPVLSY